MGHIAMYMAFSFHPYNHAGICVSHLIACVLLVPTLLCMIRHTKGLLRYLYSSNYPTVDCIFHLYFSWNTVGDCKYSSGIAHCRFNAQEQVQGVQSDPSTPSKEPRKETQQAVCGQKSTLQLMSEVRQHPNHNII